MPMGWCPRPASQTPSRPPGTGLRGGNPAPACAIPPHQVLLQNPVETAVFAPKYEANADASGYVPGAGCGFRARVQGEGDGVCAGKREREKWIQDYAVERGCAPGRNIATAARCVLHYSGQDT